MSEPFGSIATDSTSYGEVARYTCYRIFLVHIAVTKLGGGNWKIGEGALAAFSAVGLRTGGHTSNFCKCMSSADYRKIKAMLLLEGITEGIKKTKKDGKIFYWGIEATELYTPCDYWTQCDCYSNNHLKGPDGKLLHSGSGCWVTSMGDCRQMSGSADDVMQDIINHERQNACDCS